MTHLSRIKAITLQHDSFGNQSPIVQRERDIAIHDLTETASWPLSSMVTPLAIEHIHLLLSLKDNRLIIEILTMDGTLLSSISLPMTPLRATIKDYMIICDSYHQALSDGMPPHKLEAIDMGRRGIHNEASMILMELLADYADLDHQTARRFFTLIYALHMRQL
jgi:uncharacterized protein (UPF0262 family)